MMVKDVEVCLNRSSTLPFTILYKVLMVMGEVDICLRPPLILTIIQVILVDHWDFIVIVMTEVDIGLRPANFIHMTMVDYTFPTQGFLKNLFQGVWKEKIHIKIILTTLIQAFKHTLVQACHNILITTCHLILIQSF